MTKLIAEDKDGVTIVRFDGPLSADAVVKLEPEFEKVALQPEKRVVIDLSKVDLLATPAITMFMAAMKYQRANGGRVIFTGTQGAIDHLLHVCRLDMIMTIVHDPQAAVSQAAR